MNEQVYVDCYPASRDVIRRLRLDASHPEVHIHVGDPDAPTLRALTREARVVLNGHTPMDRDLLQACRQLKRIIFLGTGASSYIDLEAASSLGIEVQTIRNYGDRTNAEHAFALVMDAARRVSEMDRHMRHGRWETLPAMELSGKRLGVIGVGGIGTEMIRLAHGFGMKVAAWNRSPIPDDLPCQALAFKDLLSTSDVITLHLAYNKGTHAIIDRAAFDEMKPGVIFVNAARGGLVDEDALLDALRSGRVSHAGLDVFTHEPLPIEHPLRQMENVTLTAHAAFSSKEASERLLSRAFSMLDEQEGSQVRS